MFLDKCKIFLKKIKNNLINGYKWLGNDGVINLETSALLTIILALFFSPFWAALITFFIVIGKCTLDKSRGHENELHDFICAIMGIAVGLSLGVAYGITYLI